MYKRQHIAFIDLEAFYRIKRDKLWEVLNKKGYPKHLIDVLKNLYNGTAINVVLEDRHVPRGPFN